MDGTSDLLVEIGTEELPPTTLPILSEAFERGFRDRLGDLCIGFADIHSYASPRRLAVLIRGVRLRQSDRDVVRRGPSIRAAFDSEGRPTKAALGFAASCGTSVEGLETEAGEKGGSLVFRCSVTGAETASLVPGLTESVLTGLPIAKRMRWGAGDEEFVRPIHWVCLLLGSELIPGRVMGVDSGRWTHGHRFHHPDRIEVREAAEYADLLRTIGWVEPDFGLRRERIRALVVDLAGAEGLRPMIDDGLLDEVTALVEWPSAVVGRFDERYLEMPPEVLIETMRANQKYFPLQDESGRLRAYFIAVTNIESRDPEQVRAGNERVIRPRFADAAFFWAQDMKVPLERFADRLDGVVFQERLGSLADKARRVEKLAGTLAPALGLDPALASRAAHLARADLVSAMVYEFPALQGTMGRYYAERSGEEPGVAAAMEEQYLPRFAGDRLPAGACGRALAVADRLDTLVGIFGVGLRPTGTKDPYGLRRASIGLLRILIETPLELDLADLVELAASAYPSGVLRPDAETAVLNYVLDRLRGYYLERGVPPDTLDAVSETGVTIPADLDRRVRAVTAFRERPAASALASANKRIRNILEKSGARLPVGMAVERPSDALLQDPAERRLAEKVEQLASVVLPLAARQEYVGVLERLAELAEDLDAFFEQVMVMVEDEKVRANRIRLLQGLAGLFLLVADISRLQ